MKPYQLNSILLALSIFLALVSSKLLMSCSGGGGPHLASGGIDGSGVISKGPISTFGSIFVNGTEFDTELAAVKINGNDIGIGEGVVRENLDVGRVVTVEGQRYGNPNNAVALLVSYNNNVKGPVESIVDMDPNSREIVILGQRVIANAATVFKNTSFDSIETNDYVEVSGLIDDAGVIWATFIGKIGDLVPGLEVEATGYVTNLNPISMAFEINGLTVDYFSANTDSLPGGVPVEGGFVETKGILDSAGEVMLASLIQPGDELESTDSDEIEVTGFVTNLVSPTDFSVGNQPVQTSVDTLFFDGTPADIALGQKLEAEGILLDGVLLAAEIEFWDPDQIEVEGFVTEVVSPVEFTIGAQRVQTAVATVYEGGTPDDILLGVKIEVKGVPSDVNRSVLFADKVSFEE